MFLLRMKRIDILIVRKGVIIARRLDFFSDFDKDLILTDGCLGEQRVILDHDMLR